jgi:hypothetical protein
VVAKPDTAGTKYINRLTPMTLMGKATEKGLEEVAKAVLGEHFGLIRNEEEEEFPRKENDAKEDRPKRKAYSVSWDFPRRIWSKRVFILTDISLQS